MTGAVARDVEARRCYTTAAMAVSSVLTPRLERLRACWHAVAYGRDLGPSPLRVELLEESLVLWRDSHGIAHAFRDLCIHRGTALSRGRVAGDEIVCAYHGWRYAPDGRCTAIPQLEDPARVPAKARAMAYRCQERYGLVWVALEEPRWSIPELPELGSPGWKTVLCGPYAWNAEASRQIENFTDLGHFPWVHPGIARRSQPRGGDPARGRHARTRPPLSIRARRRPRAPRSTPCFPTRTASAPCASPATRSTCPTRSSCT